MGVPGAGRIPQATAYLLVVLAVAVVYVPTLGIPFIGDDYVFLDKTRLAGFGQLWSRANTNFGWYRPWSREFYFWAIQHLAGPSPFAFRAANLALWSVSLFVFAAAVRRLSDARTAAIATTGLASLGLWGAPLLWISGSQDLWMFFFLGAALLCIATGRDRWVAVPYLGALLSKETAAVFPLMAFAAWWLVQRRSPRELGVRLAPLVVLTMAWFFVHPVLGSRLVHGSTVAPGAERPLAAWAVVVKTALSMANADQIGDALLPTPGSIATVATGTILLAAAMWFATRIPAPAAPDRPARRVMALGGCWALAGWLPLFLPTISWHAYYGCIGAAGAWVFLAAWWGDRRRLLVALALALGTLRLFNTSSRAWDWGSEWYQRRAGLILGGIESELLARYPRLPAHTRVFFGTIPNNIGLVAGSSPALRVWYRDSTLQAGFYSYYRPRAATAAPGPDLFFHFDSTRGLEEVRLGPEDVAQAVRSQPDWEGNHESLAIVLLGAGDCSRAADEFEKLAELPRRADALMFAAVCREAAGDSVRARRLLAGAAARTGGTPGQIADWAQRLRATMPRGRGSSQAP